MRLRVMINYVEMEPVKFFFQHTLRLIMIIGVVRARRKPCARRRWVVARQITDGVATR